MMHTTSVATLASALAAILLAGCAHAPFGGSARAPSPPSPSAARAETAARRPPPEPPVPAASVDRAQVALRDGISAYNNGDYNGAIRKLAAPEIAKSSKANQLTAIKYTAFSYCVSGRPGPCRYQFDKALRLDPGFELEAGENGHPLWGPVFARAKQGRARAVK
jgi:hypothetical protein